MIEIYNEFLNQLKKYKITLNLNQQELFKIYADLLMKSNQQFNLTSHTDVKTIYFKGFLDSLSLIPHLKPTTKKIIDIGTGAGFPGLPLAIVLPEIEVHLLESNLKKVQFLEKMVVELELKNVVCIRSRAEDYTPPFQYDYVVSRAMARMAHLVEFGYPLVKTNGSIIGFKGKNLDTEMMNASPILERYKLDYKSILAEFLDTEHKFAIITKRSNIKLKKRHMSQIKKKPLWL